MSGIQTNLTREPGGTNTGEIIRMSLLKAHKMHPKTELLLFEAARAQHMEERIIPALEAGTWVICDRFIDSTTAYQGAARSLDMDWVKKLNHYATGGRNPDITFLLDLDPKIRSARTSGRTPALGEENDPMELESIHFFEKVRKEYLNLADQEPGRFRIIDASQCKENVLQQTINILKNEINQH